MKKVDSVKEDKLDADFQFFVKYKLSVALEHLAADMILSFMTSHASYLGAKSPHGIVFVDQIKHSAEEMTFTFKFSKLKGVISDERFGDM